MADKVSEISELADLRRAWIGGGDGLEKRELRLGFVPLTDCAPLAIAKERGFFRKHGLHVELSREPSWANVRDKVATGVLDGAQMLGPMPLASALGIDGMQVPMVTALSLDLNGNAITVSERLYAEMLELSPDALEQRPVTAQALRGVIEARASAGADPLVFAVVFPFSSHAYELRYWLASAGIDPDRDVRIVVAPPPSMASMLAGGSVDGFCVGEPWNGLAVHLGIGRTLVTKHELWSNSPEKVLGVTERWAEENPSTHAALIRALVEAARWLDRRENRQEVVHAIAGESYVGAPVEVVMASMTGSYRYAPEDRRELPDFNVFYRYAATFPWKSHAAWFVSQMLRWGQIAEPFELAPLLDRVVRTDIYRDAVADLDVPTPTVDHKIEGTHALPWTLEEASTPIPMGPDRFFDGVPFDAEDLCGYIERMEISSLQVPLDEIAA